MRARSVPKVVGGLVFSTIYCHGLLSYDKERCNRASLGFARAAPSIIPVSFCDAEKGNKWIIKWKPDVVVGDAEANYQKALKFFARKDRSKRDEKNGLHALNLAAEQGHTQAQNDLGRIHFNNKNFNAAVKYFQWASEVGHSGAQFLLGGCFYRGDGIKRNPEEAKRYTKMAADQGNKYAMFTLAAIYMLQAGKDAKGSDAVSAAEYFIRSADLGHKKAQFYAGRCLASGFGVDKDEARAFMYFEKAASQGWPAAQFIVAAKIFSEKNVAAENMQEMERLLKSSAAQGFLQSQFVLATSYRNGMFGTDPVEQSAQALHYYKLAADQGHLCAAYETGLQYEKKGNFDEALHYLYFAYRNDNLAAQSWIGHCYIHGHGVDKNVEEGLRMIHEAADQGCSQANQQLVKLYTTGAPGVPPSAEMAQKYKELIAEQKQFGTYMSLNKISPNFWKLYKW